METTFKIKNVSGSKLLWLLGTLLFCALFLVSSNASAQTETGPRSHLFKFGIGANIGWGVAAAPGDASTTVVGGFDGNANLGLVMYNRFVIGARADYRFVTQFSSVDPKVGNRRGYSLSVPSPLVGIFIRDFYLSASYVFAGELDLQNTTISGSSVKYISPSGYRFDFEWELAYFFKPTLYYESVTFNGLVSGQSSIPSSGPLALNTYGIGVIWTY